MGRDAGEILRQIWRARRESNPDLGLRRHLFLSAMPPRVRCGF